ncbi:MAG: 1-acyl-sn-glycerol-3-phosphate acyltransferase [Bacteroidetes bacterium]|nr:1-acyl-sn-glycerol-3-phosphate acyltransferase [Bacteroidota bacterium]
MQKLFTSDNYDTPDDSPRAIGDILALNTRVYFMSKYISIVLRCRKEAMEGRYDREAWVQSSIDIFRLIESCGGRFHIVGLDNIRKSSGPAVFVSNHMSTLETMVFPGIIASEKEATFVVKESLVRHPFFGAIMRSRNPIVLGRENSREDLMVVLSKGQELLSAGTSVIIFPQSTRMVKFVPEKFNSLGVKLAANAKVQVIPVAIKTDFWGMGKYLKDLGPIRRDRPIHIAFGEPMTISGTGKQENARIIDFVISHLREWGGEIG